MPAGTTPSRAIREALPASRGRYAGFAMDEDTSCRRRDADVVGDPYPAPGGHLARVNTGGLYPGGEGRGTRGESSPPRSTASASRRASPRALARGAASVIKSAHSAKIQLPFLYESLAGKRRSRRSRRHVDRGTRRCWWREPSLRLGARRGAASLLATKSPYSSTESGAGRPAVRPRALVQVVPTSRAARLPRPRGDEGRSRGPRSGHASGLIRAGAAAAAAVAARLPHARHSRSSTHARPAHRQRLRSVTPQPLGPPPYLTHRRSHRPRGSLGARRRPP